jgi:hypothetical protein
MGTLVFMGQEWQDQRSLGKKEHGREAYKEG